MVFRSKKRVSNNRRSKRLVGGFSWPRYSKGNRCEGLLADIKKECIKLGLKNSRNQAECNSLYAFVNVNRNSEGLVAGKTCSHYIKKKAGKCGGVAEANNLEMLLEWLKTQSKDDLSIAVLESDLGLSDTAGATFDPAVKQLAIGWYNNNSGAAAAAPKKSIKAPPRSLLNMFNNNNNNNSNNNNNNNNNNSSSKSPKSSSKSPKSSKSKNNRPAGMNILGPMRREMANMGKKDIDTLCLWEQFPTLPSKDSDDNRAARAEFMDTLLGSGWMLKANKSKMKRNYILKLLELHPDKSCSTVERECTAKQRKRLNEMTGLMKDTWSRLGAKK